LDLRFDHNLLPGFKPATLFQFGFAVFQLKLLPQPGCFQGHLCDLTATNVDY
jgi:hypothetical protein